MKWSRLSLSLVLSASLLLAACGFELRGTADLAFDTLHLQGANLTVNRDLKKSLKINGVEVVADPQKADLLIDMLSEEREQNILSLSGGGLVREFELVYRVNFRMKGQGAETWGEVQTIEGRREFSYDDAEILAKQFELELLYENMRSDTVREIMRLLVVQNPKRLS